MDLDRIMWPKNTHIAFTGNILLHAYLFIYLFTILILS